LRKICRAQTEERVAERVGYAPFAQLSDKLKVNITDHLLLSCISSTFKCV